MIVIEVMPSPDRRDNQTIQHGSSFLGAAPDVTRAIFFRASLSASAAVILPACPRRTPPKPDEERENEAHRRQAAKLTRVDHQEALAISRDR